MCASIPTARVTLANLRPKSKQKLDLGIEALGFVNFDRKAIELPAVGALDLGTLKLEPSPVVRVEVTSFDGTPVVGATVRVREDRSDGARLGGIDVAMFAGAGGTRTAKTDGQGRCAINASAGVDLFVTVSSS